MFAPAGAASVADHTPASRDALGATTPAVEGGDLVHRHRRGDGARDERSRARTRGPAGYQGVPRARGHAHRRQHRRQRRVPHGHRAVGRRIRRRRDAADAFALQPGRAARRQPREPGAGHGGRRPVRRAHRLRAHRRHRYRRAACAATRTPSASPSARPPASWRSSWRKGPSPSTASA